MKAGMIQKGHTRVAKEMDEKKQRTLEAFPVGCFIIGYEGMQRIHLL